MPLDLNQIGVAEFLKNGGYNIFSVIKVTSSCTGDDITKIFRDLADTESSWRCTGTNQQWILFTFSDSFFYIKKYLITSSFNFPNSADHLKNWKILGSIDGKSWETLKVHTNSGDINQYHTTKTYNTDKEGLFKYIKLQQSGVNWGNTYGFSLNHMDFYGILYDDPKSFPINYCVCTNTNIHTHCNNFKIPIHISYLFILLK